MDVNTKAIYDNLSREIADLRVKVEGIEAKINQEYDKGKKKKDQRRIDSLEEDKKTLNDQIEKYQNQQNTILGNSYFYFILFYFIHLF